MCSRLDAFSSATAAVATDKIDPTTNQPRSHHRETFFFLLASSIAIRVPLCHAHVPNILLNGIFLQPLP